MKNVSETIKEIHQAGLPVALWGASKNNVGIIHDLNAARIAPCAVIDSDERKHGEFFLNIPIVAFETADQRWPDMHIWVAEGSWKYQIVGRLTNELGFPKKRIINYEPVIRKKACPFLENSFVCLTEGFQFCCLMSGRNVPPFVEFDGDYSDAFERWTALREELRDSIQRGVPSRCDGCLEIREDYFAENPKIETINYSPGGICNLNCIYCESDAKHSHGTWETDADFQTILDILKQKDLLSDILHFDISPGETALNRNKNRYYSLFHYAQSTTVMTNATVYDEALAECMREGTANLCVSVDAGTRETFKKVRGADLFEKQRENLKKYSSIAPGAVDLKYIFIPGYNDNPEDVFGFAELCAEVKPSAAFLTYDIFNPAQTAPPSTVAAAQKMIAALKEKEIMYKINSEILTSAGLT